MTVVNIVLILYTCGLLYVCFEIIFLNIIIFYNEIYRLKYYLNRNDTRRYIWIIILESLNSLILLIYIYFAFI